MASENASKIDILVDAWGYNDLLNEPTFEELPYYIHVFVGIFISVLLLLGCLVCFGLLWVHKTLSRYLIDPSGLLLINFLVANLASVTLQVPFSATSSFFGKWIFGGIGCQMYAAIGFVSGISSIFSLFLLVLEFYLYTEKTRLSLTYFQKSAKDRGFLHLKWIFGQWIVALLLTGPPLMGTLGRMHVSPFGTMCTIDYWHGNFKNYRAYMTVLMINGFFTPFMVMSGVYFRGLQNLVKHERSRSPLSKFEHKHIVGMAKLCAIGFVNVIFAWSPFFLLCLYTLIAGAHDLSVFATLIPPMVAKVKNCRIL